MAPMSPRTPLILAALLIATIAVSGPGRRAGRRGLSRGRGRSGRAARLGRAAGTSNPAPPPRSSRAPSTARASSSTRPTTRRCGSRGGRGRSRSTRRRRSATPRAGRSTGSSSTRSRHDSAASSSTRSRSTGSPRARRGATRRSSSRSAASCRSTPRPGSGSGSTATLRSSLSGSNWLFTKANGIIDLYRWLPWVSRRIAFDRPNHGDPFETPSSRSVRGQDRDLAAAGAGDERRPDRGQRRRADPDVRGDERARLHGDRRDRLPDAGRGSSAIRSCASTTGPGRPARRCSTPRPTRSTSSSAGSGRIHIGRSGSPSRPGRTGWSRRG